MTAKEFQRWLAKHGCTFRPGKGGHLKVELDGKFSIMPMHGSTKQLAKGTENAIKKQLGLK